MSSILSDPAVIVSVVVGVLMAATVLLLDRTTSKRVPTAIVGWTAIVAAVPLANVNLVRYRPNTLTAHSAWMIAVLIVAMVVAVTSATIHWDDAGSRANTTVALAAAASSLFLFIPETDLLRLAPGPLMIVAVGVVFVGLPPFGPLGMLTVGAALIWISVIDGAARPGTVLATSAVFGLVSFAPSLGPMAGPGAADGVRTALRLAALAFGIVVAGRVLGTATSWITSWTAMAIVAVAVWTVTLRITRSER